MQSKHDQYRLIPSGLFVKGLKLDFETFITDLCSPLSITPGQESELNKTFVSMLRVVENGEWTLFLDDFSYTIYHKIKGEKHFEVKQKEYELFYFGVGDAAYDYHFAYYKDGIKIREVEVFDDWRNSKLVINDGKPTPVEIPLLTRNGEMVTQMILGVAKYFGIDSNLNNVKYYRWVKESQSNPV